MATQLRKNKSFDPTILVKSQSPGNRLNPEVRTRNLMQAAGFSQQTSRTALMSGPIRANTQASYNMSRGAGDAGPVTRPPQPGLPIVLLPEGSEIRELLQGGIRGKTTAELFDLGKKIVEEAAGDPHHAKALALCATCLVRSERHCTFLNSLLNCCQFMTEELFRRGETTPARFHGSIIFFTHLYKGLKKVPLEEKPQYTGTAPWCLLAHLLAKVCAAVLQAPTVDLPDEGESIQTAVTIIGPDLQMENSSLLEMLIINVRQAVIKSKMSERTRKSLMHLIELAAANWKLPSIVNHYYNNFA